jgi:hypothetical protein
MYLARFATPWENTYFDRKETYSECVQEIIKNLREMPLAEVDSLEVTILKGNLESPNSEDIREEKFDLTSWIEYKKSNS